MVTVVSAKSIMRSSWKIIQLYGLYVKFYIGDMWQEAVEKIRVLNFSVSFPKKKKSCGCHEKINSFIMAFPKETLGRSISIYVSDCDCLIFESWWHDSLRVRVLDVSDWSTAIHSALFILWSCFYAYPREMPALGPSSSARSVVNNWCQFHSNP